MRILYYDIDTLRPDHLGCYGYHRNTSRNIDRLAAEGVRFENCYVSDSPCMPSRAALLSGCCGIRNGIVNHGGGAADLAINPSERGFRVFEDHLIQRIRKAGYHTVSISPFAERHAAFWYLNGFNEVVNPGKCGGERADEVVPHALDWLDRKGTGDSWYLHVNVWDPHTPYRTPESFGNPFEGQDAPDWMTQEVWRDTWNTYGPGCAQEPGGGYLKPQSGRYPRMVDQIDSLEAYRKWIDGYDTGIRYADHHLGLILQKLADLGVLDDTLIVVSSDHGENQGELSVYGDHQTADHITNRVPFVVRHPKGVGGKGRADRALHYQFDIFSTVLELAGGEAPCNWDAVPFTRAFEAEKEDGRESLVVSNCAWAVQRSARWDRYLMVRSYHSGFKNYPDVMLFDVDEDPHELHDLASHRPELVDRGLGILHEWQAAEMARAFPATDPMQTVLREGGPFHASYASSEFGGYLERLRATGREVFADQLEARAQRAGWSQRVP